MVVPGKAKLVTMPGLRCPASCDSLRIFVFRIELWKIAFLASQRLPGPATPTHRPGPHLLPPPSKTLLVNRPIAPPHLRFLRVVPQEYLPPSLLPRCGGHAQLSVPNIVGQQRVRYAQGHLEGVCNPFLLRANLS
jgi:hypothetical protein